MQFLSIVVFLVAVLAVIYLYGRYRLHVLSSLRQTQSLDEMKQHFVQLGFPANVTEAVVKSLQEFIGVPEFPVLPNDSLDRIYGVVGEDVEELAKEVAEKCGCRSTFTDEDGAKFSPLRSVGDLVRFVSHLSREPLER